MTDRLAVRRIKRGVLPHCEAVRLVPALGGQRVLCKWSDVNLFPNYILGFKMLSKNLLLRQTLLKYSVGRLGTICAWPSGAALSWDNRQRDSDHLFVQNVYFTFLSGARFSGASKSSYWEMWNSKHVAGVTRQCFNPASNGYLPTTLGIGNFYRFFVLFNLLSANCPDWKVKLLHCLKRKHISNIVDACKLVRYSIIG